MNVMKKICWLMCCAAVLCSCTGKNSSEEEYDYYTDAKLHQKRVDFIEWVKENPSAEMPEIIDRADNAEVRMETSLDENIRIYSWISGGGTSPDWTTYTQYRDSEGQLRFKDGLPVYGVYEGITVTGIYGGDLIDGKKLYFLDYYGKASSTDAYSDLHTVWLDADTLAFGPGFRKGKEYMESIDLNYYTGSWSDATDGEGWDWIFQYDAAKNRLYAAIPDPEKCLTDRYEIYEYDGKTFTYKGDDGSPLLHPSLRDYAQLHIIQHMEKHLLRIDRMKDGTYRLALWDNPYKTKMSDEPTLVVHNGFFLEESFTYRFMVDKKIKFDFCDHTDSELRMYIDDQLLFKEKHRDHEFGPLYWIMSYQENINRFLTRPVRIEQILLTENHVIRIDLMDNGTYRYASWNRNGLSDEDQTPDLIITGGVEKEVYWENYYSFWNGSYNYLIPVGEVGHVEVTLPDRSTVKDIILRKFHVAEIEQMLKEEE